MAKTLTEFLLDNPVSEEKEQFEYTLDGRLEGAPPFKFETLDKKAFEDLKKRYTNKKGKLQIEGFTEQLVITCCLEPNFKDAELIKKLGVVTPEMALRKMLTFAETDMLAAQVMEDSGLTVNVTKLEQEVKN